MPIFDYHCHLDPQEIYEDKQFSDIGEAWLAGDHYKWRVMRTCGVPEEYVTARPPSRRNSSASPPLCPPWWATPSTTGPTWSCCAFSALRSCWTPPAPPAIWDKANSVLQSHQGTARALISSSKVRALCTTDDPADDLQYHKLLAEDKDFATQVLPTFRPDKILHVENDEYPVYLQKLGAAGVYIRTLDDVKTALKQRLDYFASCGCRLSDQSFGSPDFTVWDEEAAQEAMNKALNGEKPLDYEVAAYQSLLMDFLGGEYAARGFTMQLHLGALRNLNTLRFRGAGARRGLRLQSATASLPPLWPLCWTAWPCGTPCPSPSSTPSTPRTMRSSSPPPAASTMGPLPARCSSAPPGGSTTT